MNLPLSFNINVARDLKEILAFYEEESGTTLADAFYNELMFRIDQVEKNPKRFPFSVGDRRRVNLSRFPYHFLYRIKSNSIRVLVIRHHHRNPHFGYRRQ